MQMSLLWNSDLVRFGLAQDPAEREDAPLGGGPPDQRGQRARDRPDLGAPAAHPLCRRVPSEVGGDRQEREEGRELADLREDHDERREAHAPAEHVGGAAGNLAGRYGPLLGPVHPSVGVDLHPLV